MEKALVSAFIVLPEILVQINKNKNIHTRCTKTETSKLFFFCFSLFLLILMHSKLLILSGF